MVIRLTSAMATGVPVPAGETVGTKADGVPGLISQIARYSNEVFASWRSWDCQETIAEIQASQTRT